MKDARRLSAIVDLSVLVAVLIGVHLTYLGWIRPAAARAIDTARALDLATPRTLEIVLKDWEQEICIILLFWGVWLILSRVWRLWAHWDYLDPDILETHQLQQAQVPADNPILRAVLATIERFDATRNVHNAAEAVRSYVETTAMKLEAENTLIRYLIWAIPSIGFVGTVRGIGGALAQADKALAGDIASMTASLGVAFNSTFVALLISILLMGLLHLLQGVQDRLVIDIEEFCDLHVIARLGRPGDVARLDPPASTPAAPAAQ